jgi:L-fucose isomerase-like protein
MSLQLKPVKLGFIPANRGFFSSALAAKMRRQTIETLESLGVQVVVPSPEQTKVGCVENIAEAELAADLFRKEDVDGILISAVNFGDEQAAAWAVRQSRLDVPNLIYGCQEEETLTMKTPRRDSFCGLLSIGESLRQIGAKYTVATTPIGFPTDENFKNDVAWFMAVCRVVNGVRRARYGQVGARPEAFWTCRFDEKQLQRLGPTTVVLDLSEAFAGANKLADDDPEVTAIVSQIHDYADVSKINPASVLKSAKLERFLRVWKAENKLDALAIQCWTSIQANYGVCSCTTMSRFGDEGVPSACEADILGTLSMHTAMLASGNPAGLADWNNLHNDDENLVNVWHCGVFPKSFAKEKPHLGVQEIIAGSGAAKYEDSEGTVEFVSKPGPLTLTRATQDGGDWKVVVAQGALEDNPAVTFGSYGWCRIPGLQNLYRNVLLQHFPHHVAITQGHAGNALWEAFGNYLGFQVFEADQCTPGAYVPRLPF